MIEPGGSIELGHSLWEFRGKAPFVGSSASSLKFRGPPIPPSRYATGQRFDNEDAIATRECSIKQALQQRVARGVGQLVQRERSDERRLGLRKRKRCGVALPRLARDAKCAICVRGFAQRPRITIDRENPHRTRTLRHSYTGHASATAKINHELLPS